MHQLFKTLSIFLMNSDLQIRLLWFLKYCFYNIVFIIEAIKTTDDLRNKYSQCLFENKKWPPSLSIIAAEQSTTVTPAGRPM